MKELSALPHIAASEVPDADLRHCLLLWLDRRERDGTVPAEGEIDPFAVPSLVSSVILYDVAPDLTMRFRVIGEDVKNRVAGNPVGLPPSAVVGDDEYGQFIVAQLTQCAEAGLPIYSHHDFLKPGETVSRPSARIAMPYSNGRRVTRLLCFQKFSDDLTLRTAGEATDWHVVTLALVDRR